MSAPPRLDTDMRKILIALGCLTLAGIAGYNHYLQSPNYALRQIGSAAERQDPVTLAKYIDFGSIVAGLIAPLEAKAEAGNKQMREYTEAKKAEARRRAAASNDPFAESLERMKESTADLAKVQRCR